ESTAVEALLRWRRGDGRIVTATEFIQVAEDTGLIHELTDWILHTAVSTAAGWRADGWPQATVAINVSAPQFFESDFVDHVARTLEASGLPASALELEITETVFQTGAATIDSLRQLRALGVQGFLLGKPVEASLAAAEAQAAAARARQALENAAFAPRRDAGESLVLFGSSGRRRAT